MKWGGAHDKLVCPPPERGWGGGGVSGHIPPSFPASRAVSWHLWKTQAANPAPTSPNPPPLTHWGRREPCVQCWGPPWPLRGAPRFALWPCQSGKTNPTPQPGRRLKAFEVSVGRDREKKTKQRGKTIPTGWPRRLCSAPSTPPSLPPVFVLRDHR